MKKSLALDWAGSDTQIKDIPTESVTWLCFAYFSQKNFRSKQYASSEALSGGMLCFFNIQEAKVE
jgi:hypothetical protein